MHTNPILNSAGEIEKAGCVVLNERGEILLVTNPTRDNWGLPKGHAEAGESPVEVAVRETREETGYEVEIIRQLDDVAYTSGQTGMPIRVHFFLAKPSAHHAEADEAWEWVAMDRAKQLVWPNIRAFLEQQTLEF